MVAENLLLALDGTLPVARCKLEPICIVDTLARGILIHRDKKRALILPRCRLMHSVKRLSEWLHLPPCRKSRRANPTGTERVRPCFRHVIVRTMPHHREGKRVADVNPDMCQFAERLTMDEIRNPAIGLGAS